MLNRLETKFVSIDWTEVFNSCKRWFYPARRSVRVTRPSKVRKRIRGNQRRHRRARGCSNRARVRNLMPREKHLQRRQLRESARFVAQKRLAARSMVRTHCSIRLRAVLLSTCRSRIMAFDLPPSMHVDAATRSWWNRVGLIIKNEQ